MSRILNARGWKDISSVHLRGDMLRELEKSEYDIIEVNRGQAIKMNDWNDISYKYSQTGNMQVIWTTIFGSIYIQVEPLTTNHHRKE